MLLSSCLAGPVVVFGHQAAWWPGVHIGGWNPDRVSVSTLTPGAVMFGAAAAWREVLYFLGQFKCAATAACWHIWCVGLLPRISDARSCAYCRCLRHCVRLRWCLGVRGYYNVRLVGLQGGNSRPPWKSPPGAAASMVFGSCFIILQTLTQMISVVS